MRRLLTKLRDRNERGQALIVMALSAVVVMGMTGLAIDAGRVYSTRAKLVRAVDAGALAGVQSFPDVNKAKAHAAQYVATNEPGAITTVSQIGSERKLRVTAQKKVPTTFLRVLNRNDITVKASAVAGFGGILDLVLVMDQTGSMAGSPETEAKKAAVSVVEMLLPNDPRLVAVGLTGYRSCYYPPTVNNACTSSHEEGINRSNMSIPLGTNKSQLLSTIGNVDAGGRWATTNICEGLLEGKRLIEGAGKHDDPRTARVVILLADGENNPEEYRANKWSSQCDPGDGHVYQSNCSVNTKQSATVDKQMYNLAQQMRASGVQIYVVGLSVCGTKNDSKLCDASKITGNASNDSDADRNVMKCMASSTAGTNDHYFEANNASQLNGIFQGIVSMVASRLME